ncbi:MAG: TonB family protein [Planctomycetes bacterium]|nr:TonB family protein [Planctomycetota bacterium]
MTTNPSPGMFAGAVAASLLFHAALCGLIEVAGLLPSPGLEPSSPFHQQGEGGAKVEALKVHPRLPPKTRLRDFTLTPRLQRLPAPAPTALEEIDPIPPAELAIRAEALLTTTELNLLDGMTALTEPSPPPGVDRPRLDQTSIAPVYPRSCQFAGHEGLALVRVELDGEGKVLSARLLSSAGCPELDRAALEAAERARFETMAKGGGIFRIPIAIPIRFRLR